MSLCEVEVKAVVKAAASPQGTTKLTVGDQIYETSDPTQHFVEIEITPSGNGLDQYVVKDEKKFLHAFSDATVKTQIKDYISNVDSGNIVLSASNEQEQREEVLFEYNFGESILGRPQNNVHMFPALTVGYKDQSSGANTTLIAPFTGI